jgi:hypothetical protein
MSNARAVNACPWRSRSKSHAPSWRTNAIGVAGVHDGDVIGADLVGLLLGYSHDRLCLFKSD